MSEFWIGLFICMGVISSCFAFNYIKELYDYYKRKKRFKKNG